MFQRIQQYELIEAGGVWYRPRAYGEMQLDGRWDGWLVFFSAAGGRAIAPASPETTQSTLPALAHWAAGLTPVYLEGALARALKLTFAAPVIDWLAATEYEAVEDAAQLEASADLKRSSADLDEAAASVARADAERIHRERIVTEGALAAADEAAATIEASMHEDAAREARAVAADAGARRRRAEDKAAPNKRTKSAGKKK